MIGWYIGVGLFLYFLVGMCYSFEWGEAAIFWPFLAIAEFVIWILDRFFDW